MVSISVSADIYSYQQNRYISIGSNTSGGIYAACAESLIMSCSVHCKTLNFREN